MNLVDRLSETLKKMPEEERQKFKPVIKRLLSTGEAFKEGIERKNNFTAQFTTVVGVLFGVLATFNTIGQNIWADIAYLTGIICCGICLVLCVICLYKPIYDNNRHKESAIFYTFEALFHAYGKDKEFEEEFSDEPEKYFPFDKLRLAAYILFGISILCVLVKICILFYSAYYC